MMPPLARYESLAERSHHLGRANGFDAIRLFLALGIVAFHSVTLSGRDGADIALPLQLAARLILPALFVLSGYLVTASLLRAASVREFLFLRLLRIWPLLSLVVAATALVLGPLFTACPLAGYFSSAAVPDYFWNVFGLSQFGLPCLFVDNPRAGIVNGSLWTIQLELLCYGALAILTAAVSRRWLGLALLGLMPLLAFADRLGLDWLPAPDLLLAFVCGALAQLMARHLPLHPAGGAVCLAAAYWPSDAPLIVIQPLLAYGVIWLGLRSVPRRLTRADLSYGLYLTGYPLAQSVIALKGPMDWPALLAITLPSGLAVAALLWWGVEARLLSRKHQIAAWICGRPLPEVARR